MPRALSLASLLVALLVAVAGCGSDESAADLTPSKDSGGTPTIDISIGKDGVDPEGAVVKVQSGEPIILKVRAQKAGELHVHSTPEKEIAYSAGTSEHRLELTQPGVVDVEDHELEALILQIQVH